MSELLQALLEMPPDAADAVLADLDAEQLRRLLFDWRFWARAEQLPPSDGQWFVWLLLGGRGAGKTRCGAEWVRERVEGGQARRIALVAETAADARDVLIHGESGLLAVCPPWNRPVHEPSKRALTWPNGAMALTFSGDDPEQLRGPQFDTAWVDELGKYRYAEETWSNLEFGLRLGDPQVVVTTTPRPLKLLEQMLTDPQVRVSTESTYRNLMNLSPKFIQRVIRRYEGTRLGEQELHARMLRDVPGALWTIDILDRTRATRKPLTLARIVIGVDPAQSAEEDADETGIVVVGRTVTNHGYVLEDASGHYSPAEWPKKLIELFGKYKADRVVCEQGIGNLLETTLRYMPGGSMIPVTMSRAYAAKHVRAEPVALLYEQGRVHNVGRFDVLEQQCRATTRDGYTGTGSPDRMDAMVYAALELFDVVDERRGGFPAVRAA